MQFVNMASNSTVGQFILIYVDTTLNSSLIAAGNYTNYRQVNTSGVGIYPNAKANLLAV
jgi:hypothetical protein